jgi:hypothetical protein
LHPRSRQNAASELRPQAIADALLIATEINSIDQAVLCKLTVIGFSIKGDKTDVAQILL